MLQQNWFHSLSLSKACLGWGCSIQTDTGAGEEVETGGRQDGNGEKGEFVEKTASGMCYWEKMQVWAGCSIVPTRR